MVVQVDNPANKHMHNGDTPVVKTIDGPGFLPKRHLYSNAEAQKQFDQVQMDIYETQQKTKPPKKKGFPTVLKFALGIGTAVAAIIFRKDICNFVTKTFNKIFK